MRIKINLLSYEQPEYEVLQSTSISEVKQQFQNEFGIPMENFQFYFNGEPLQSNQTIGHCNIPDGALLEIHGNLLATLHPRNVQSARLHTLLSELAGHVCIPSNIH